MELHHTMYRPTCHPPGEIIRRSEPPRSSRSLPIFTETPWSPKVKIQSSSNLTIPTIYLAVVSQREQERNAAWECPLSGLICLHLSVFLSFIRLRVLTEVPCSVIVSSSKKDEVETFDLWVFCFKSVALKWLYGVYLRITKTTPRTPKYMKWESKVCCRLGWD